MSETIPAGDSEEGNQIPRMVPFGPAFFLTHLAAFVRQQCPDPKEGLPFVHLHLVGGEVLELCHVIGLTPCWIALAVYDDGAGTASRAMRTELVPYELMMRIAIRVGQGRGSHLGFHQESPPTFSASPEEALQVAATPTGVHERRTLGMEKTASRHGLECGPTAQRSATRQRSRSGAR